MEKQSPWECAECRTRFTPEDEKRFEYWSSTVMCAKCYSAWQALPRNQCCFGKVSLYDKRGKELEHEYAYDPQAINCREDTGPCPHKRICPLFALGKITGMQQEMLQQYPKIPFKQRDTVIYAAFKLCLQGTTKQELHRLVTEENGDPVRVLRIMRKGTANDAVWLFDEVEDVIKIYYPT